MVIVTLAARAVNSSSCAAPTVATSDVLTKLVNLWPASRIDELMP
jgi:hypothetical protein